MMPTHYSEENLELIEKLTQDIQHCLRYNTELESESSVYVDGLCRRVNSELRLYRSKMNTIISDLRKKVANQIWASSRDEWVRTIVDEGDSISFLTRMDDECRCRIEEETESKIGMKCMEYANTISRKVRETGGMVYIRSSTKKEAVMSLDDTGIYHEDTLRSHLVKHTRSIELYVERKVDMDKRWGLKYVPEPRRTSVKDPKITIDYHLSKLRESPREYGLNHPMKHILRVLALENYYHDTKINLLTSSGYTTFKIEWYEALAKYYLPENILKMIIPKTYTKESIDTFINSLENHLGKFVRKILDEMYADQLFYLTPFTFWDNYEMGEIEEGAEIDLPVSSSLESGGSASDASS